MLKNVTFTIILSLFIIGEYHSQSPNSYTYTGKPRFQILTKRNNTTLGIINVELFPNIAPKHTRNFDSLVSKQFYDTTAFHRVIPGFMIQGGDPNSRHDPKPSWGYGQPGQPMVNAEFSVAKHLRGILSAARSNNINSATSQFFICHAAAPSLNGNYSIYGRVTSGINFVDTIANAPKDVNNNPNDKIEMFVTYIGSNDTVPNPPLQWLPKNDSLNVDTMTLTNIKWKAQSDGIIYHLDISTDSTFATITTTVNTAELYYGVPAGLQSNTKYFWRVQTNNGGHFSAFSPVWHFKTLAPYSDVGIKKNALIKEVPVIFPNPSSGKFTFTNIEKGITLEVFDINGKLIYQTISKETSVLIDLEGKDKGVYTYRLTNLKQEVRQGKLLVK
jgi:peptidyl-prolyl cis-trans isomerase B (cyclophilin B)